MREDIKKWVEALESGEYKQTQNKLAGNGGYCCLGVYAEVSDIDCYDKMVGYLGSNETEDYGLAKETYNKLYKTLYPIIDVDYLVELNDVKGASFKDIAAYIRENYYTDEKEADSCCDK